MPLGITAYTLAQRLDVPRTQAKFELETQLGDPKLARAIHKIAAAA